MKAYMAIIDGVGNSTTSVVKTNTPIEMLKHIFISGTTGEFHVTSPLLSDRVFEINQFWVDHTLVDLSVNEVLDQLLSLLSVEDNDEAEESILEMMGDGLTDQPIPFLQNLRLMFNGEIEDLSEMTEEQTFLLVMMQL